MRPWARLSGAARGVAAGLGTAEGCATLAPAESAADIVVNNLGTFQPGDFIETDDATWVANIVVCTSRPRSHRRQPVRRCASMEA
jgi:hypothetical protein